MPGIYDPAKYHGSEDASLVWYGGADSASTGTASALPRTSIPYVETFSYDFRNFFHPFVGDLIKQLNQTSVAGMLDPDFLATLDLPYTADDYTPLDSDTVSVTLEDRVIDVSIGGPYANYNWELLYHIPVMVAVHLSAATSASPRRRSGSTSSSTRPARTPACRRLSGSGNPSSSGTAPASRTSTPCSAC